MKSLLCISALVCLGAFLSGCGDQEDYQARYLELRERHNAEIARLKVQHEQETKEWRRQIRAYEERLRALRGQLDREPVGVLGHRANRDPLPTAKDLADGMNAQTGTVPESEATGALTGVPAAGLLEAFAKDYAPRIEESRREQFAKDFTAYVAELRKDGEGADAQTRDRMLEVLQTRIASAASEREREELKRRQETIRSASDEDLQDVLAYYQELDNFRELEQLMDEYGISREELRLKGIEPPPQNSWGPDTKEIAYNLKNFVDVYAPLTNPSEREQYRKDFAAFLSGLTSTPSDEQIRERRASMLAELEAQAASGEGANPERLERRMEYLRNADTEELRRMVRGDYLRELNTLVEKYNIPADELRQSGIPIQRARTGGRPRR